ncbi:Serine/threonine-protein kinase PRP4 [Glycine soja]
MRTHVFLAKMKIEPGLEDEANPSMFNHNAFLHHYHCLAPSTSHQSRVEPPRLTYREVNRSFAMSVSLLTIFKTSSHPKLFPRYHSFYHKVSNSVTFNMLLNQYKITCSGLDVPSSMYHLNLEDITKCRIRKIAKIGARRKTFCETQSLESDMKIVFKFSYPTINYTTPITIHDHFKTLMDCFSFLPTISHLLSFYYLGRTSKRHRHRHRSRKSDEEIECGCEIAPAVPFPTPPRNSGTNFRVIDDDDVEEGEIFEDDDDVAKQHAQSEAEPGEIDPTGDRGVRSDNKNLGHFARETLLHAKDIETKTQCNVDDRFISPDGEDGACYQSHVGRGIHEDGMGNGLFDGKDGRASTDGMGNGLLDHKHGCFKGNEKLKGYCDDEDVEVDGGKVGYYKNSSSESGREKDRRSRYSHSRDRYRSRSRSTGHATDRSHSGSITDYDLDDERMMASRRESRDLVVDKRREHRTSYHTQEAWGRARSSDRDVDRDLKMEKEQERSRNREVNWVHRREKERERSCERHRRDVEKDRREREDDRDRRREKESDRIRETVFERDRRRDKEKDQSRDRTRGDERVRDQETAEHNDRSWKRDKIKEREKRDDIKRHKDRGNGMGKYLSHEDDYYDAHDRYRRRLKQEERECHQERKRKSSHVKVYNSMGSTLIDDANKLERGEDEQDDLDEKVTLQLPDQEEEDFNRVKEESRRRREAILEKYKKQHQQIELNTENEGKDRQAVEIPPSIPDALDGKSDGVDDVEVETLFSVRKSPAENGNVASDKISSAGGLGEGSPKSERSDDKFCDDIFGETPTGVQKSGKGEGLRIERGGLHDNWDDAEGYYSYHFGEVLYGRYEVIAAHGRGVFSAVVRAKDLKNSNGEPREVAIKIIRSNDTMYKAGMDELVILKKLVGADPDDKCHCVCFLSSFKYKNHLCLVFESLHMNLREVLKKFGRNIGLRLTAVRAYAKQLFIALKHLRNCGVLHCDIKPDNMLFCDFGNAMFAGKNEVTPYLVSRFYRAPEIILGLPYDHPLDMWSVGCCLYELYTGKVLFPGFTNNDMLWLHMELKGIFPKKMLRKGAFIEQHFDQYLNFLATEEDPVTKKAIKRMIVNIKPKDIGTIISGSPGEDPKMLTNFKDLMEKVFILDPDKRLTVSQALNHPFITGKGTMLLILTPTMMFTDICT